MPYGPMYYESGGGGSIENSLQTQKSNHKPKIIIRQKTKKGKFANLENPQLQFQC